MPPGISGHRSHSQGTIKSPRALSLRLEDMGPDHRRPLFSDAVQILRQVDGGGSDIKNEQLVVGLMDDFAAEGHQGDALRIVELAQEDAELDVFAAVLECLEEFGAALVVRHIIGAEIKPAVMI